jgi:hypothetical protein
VTKPVTTFTTRRTVLTGAVAATAATAVASTGVAQPANPSATDELAPFVDPIKVKLQYLEIAKAETAAFARLMQIFNDNKNQPPAVLANNILEDKDAGPLGRSIMLAWYLGCWFKPGSMSQFPVKVVSSAAYTQGWVWRVAQAHPMGYSELRFGYWGEQPQNLSDFVGA